MNYFLLALVVCAIAAMPSFAAEHFEIRAERGVKVKMRDGVIL